MFTCSLGGWTQQTKLIGTGAIGLAARDSSVSLSVDGNTAIIGGQADHQIGGSVSRWVGAAWVFTRSRRVWRQQTKLVGSGAVGSPTLQGFSVSLAEDGKTGIVGGLATMEISAQHGLSCALVGDGPTILVGSGVAGPFDAAQGTSVGLSTKGNSAIVGENNDDNLVGAA
jgi:hypothetical protein